MLTIPYKSGIIIKRQNAKNQQIKKGVNDFVAHWEEEYSNLNSGNNYFGIFSTIYREIPVKAFVYATCAMNEFGNKRVMFANLFFKANESEITDVIFHVVSDDCFELVKQNIPEDNLLQTSFINYSSTEELPDNVPFSFGDYSM